MNLRFSVVKLGIFCLLALLETCSCLEFQLSASSEQADHPAKDARFDYANIGSSYWCPKAPVNSVKREWLQFEYDSIAVISRLVTYSRLFIKEPGKISLSIQYQRETGGKWFNYNMDYVSPEKRVRTSVINPPITAKRIRIYPHFTASQDKEAIVCLDVDLKGDSLAYHVVEYQIPISDASNPFKRQLPFALNDSIYDGYLGGSRSDSAALVGRKSGRTYLVGGVGALVDGLAPNFSEPHLLVGWTRDHSGIQPSRNEPIEILIRFDQTRFVNKVVLAAVGDFSLNIGLFRKIAIQVCDDVAEIDRATTVASVVFGDVDLSFDGVRNVSIGIKTPLPGKLLKASLWFGLDWIALSEIYITSELPRSQSADSSKDVLVRDGANEPARSRHDDRSDDEGAGTAGNSYRGKLAASPPVEDEGRRNELRQFPDKDDPALKSRPSSPADTLLGLPARWSSVVWISVIGGLCILCITGCVFVAIARLRHRRDPIHVYTTPHLQGYPQTHTLSPQPPHHRHSHIPSMDYYM